MISIKFAKGMYEFCKKIVDYLDYYKSTVYFNVNRTTKIKNKNYPQNNSNLIKHFILVFLNLFYD